MLLHSNRKDQDRFYLQLAAFKEQRILFSKGSVSKQRSHYLALDQVAKWTLASAKASLYLWGIIFMADMKCEQVTDRGLSQMSSEWAAFKTASKLSKRAPSDV